MLRALALLSLYIPYLVQSKKQHQRKYAQLDPHAHDFTFLKAYKTPGFFVRSGRCKSTPWRLTLHSRPRFERQTDLKMLQKEQKKIDPKVDFFATEVAVQGNRING